jgi:hypothetical protein
MVAPGNDQTARLRLGDFARTIGATAVIGLGRFKRELKEASPNSASSGNQGPRTFASGLVRQGCRRSIRGGHKSRFFEGALYREPVSQTA